MHFTAALPHQVASEGPNAPISRPLYHKAKSLVLNAPSLTTVQKHNTPITVKISTTPLDCIVTTTANS